MLIAKPPLTHKQKALALTVAGLADFAQIMLFPTLFAGYIADDVVDFFVAIILTAVCGFKWQFLIVFFIELVPGLDLFPTWSAVVLTLPSVPGHDAAHQSAQSNPTQAYATSPHPPHPHHAPISVTAIPVPPVQAPPIQTNP